MLECFQRGRRLCPGHRLGLGQSREAFFVSTSEAIVPPFRVECKPLRFPWDPSACRIARVLASCLLVPGLLGSAEPDDTLFLRYAGTTSPLQPVLTGGEIRPELPILYARRPCADTGTNETAAFQIRFAGGAVAQCW